jgi:parvulin-like peptidyl-prolyl isomerase
MAGYPTLAPQVANLPVTPNYGEVGQPNGIASPTHGGFPPYRVPQGQPYQAPPGQPGNVASPAPMAVAPPGPRGELFEDAQVVAVVGDERILAGDIMGIVNQFLEANKDRIPPGREELYRKKITQQVLESEVQSKLVYLDFVRKVQGKGVGPEKVTEIHNRIYEQFDEKRLPEMMEKANVATSLALDAKLREQGSSLMKHKRQFAQKVMSQQWMRENGKINFEPVVTHAQMLDYYRDQAADYEFPAKAKWEHLMVRFEKFPNKAIAYEAIRAMGQEVYLGGAPLWAVAKRSSHGVTASDGGQFDWTTQASLKSKVLDQAIFELPLNQLSPILEDEDGFHIVRVLERQDAGRTSFDTAQNEIKEKIRKDLIQKQIDSYMAELKKKTPVWTIFDEELQMAEDAARRAAAADRETK